MIVKLKRPNYVEFDSFGSMKGLYCKICGTCIGGTQDVSKGKELNPVTKKWEEYRTRQFRRLSNYTEIKIEFEDGSSHVTNLCVECSKEDIDKDVLHQMHQADMDVEEKQGNTHTALVRKRVPVRVTAIRTDGKGII